MNTEEKNRYIDELLSFTLFKKSDYTQITKIIEKYLPIKIYKYRPSGLEGYFKDYIFDNKVYLSPITKQNDKFEGITPSTITRIKETSIEEIEEYYKNKIIKVLNYYFEDIDKSSLNEIYNYLKEDNCDFNKIKELLIKYDNSISDYMFDNIFDKIVKIKGKLNNDLNYNSKVEEGILNVINANEKTGICCFTEAPNDDDMWAHYSNNFSGYCIEYNLKPFKKNKQFINELLPVIYESKKNDDWLESLCKVYFNSISKNDYYLKMASNNFTIELVKMMCTKLLKWEKQCEWRIIGKPETKINGPSIESIIIGDNISKDDFNIIYNYCKLKNYKVRIVYSDYITQTLKIRDIVEKDIVRINSKMY